MNVFYYIQEFLICIKKLVPAPGRCNHALILKDDKFCIYLNHENKFYPFVFKDSDFNMAPHALAEHIKSEFDDLLRNAENKEN